MKDRPDSPKGTWYRRAPRANKVVPSPSVEAPAPTPTPSVTYGSCIGEVPETFACVRAAPVNVAAKRPSVREAVRAAEPAGPVESGTELSSLDMLEPGKDELDATRASAQVTSRPDEVGAPAPDQQGRASVPVDEERVTLAAPSAPSAEALDMTPVLTRVASSDDDVIVVGEADDLEFIPVGEAPVTASTQGEPSAAQDTPAVLPTTTSSPAGPALDVVAPVAGAPPRSGARRRAAWALAIAACGALALWAERDWVTSSLEGPRATAGPPGTLTRQAKLMRFDVPDLVIVMPAEPPRATAPGPATPPAKRAAGAKDAAALAELEKLAAGLPSGDSKKK